MMMMMMMMMMMIMMHIKEQTRFFRIDAKGRGIFGKEKKQLAQDSSVKCKMVKVIKK